MYLKCLPDEPMYHISNQFVAHNGTIGEWVDELRPYGKKFPEIKDICDFVDSNHSWFERAYAFGRADIILFLREAGRNI